MYLRRDCASHIVRKFRGEYDHSIYKLVNSCGCIVSDGNLVLRRAWPMGLGQWPCQAPARD